MAMPLGVLATDLGTGQGVLFRRGDVAQALLAKIGDHVHLLGLFGAQPLVGRHAAEQVVFAQVKISLLNTLFTAIFLLGVAAMMVVGSVERILSPQPIRYQEAIVVAVLGLVVNLVCALILGQSHEHGHGHGHAHGHSHGHAPQDPQRRSTEPSMPHAFADIAFTPSVKAAQQRVVALARCNQP